MTVERHYSTAELADLLSVHPDTILRLAQKGELKSSYVGRERRYPESGVNLYLDRTARKATAPQSNVVPFAERRRT